MAKPSEPDLSEFRELNGLSGSTGRCGTGEFIATLNDQEREQVHAAFADRRIQATAIHKWMMKRGYRLRPESVRVHRKGDCPCARS